MSYKPWTKIDDGAEGAWKFDTWISVLEAIAQHEGERVYDKNSKIYSALEQRLPSLTWYSYENGNFRPYFRDFAKPWTVTQVATFDEEFKLTPIGREIISGKLSPAAFFFKFCSEYTENNERPFAILASGFSEAAKPLSLVDLYFAISTGYRNPDDRIENLLDGARERTESEIPATHKRRLVLMLSIMERTGAIYKGGSTWHIWDQSKLVALSGTKAPPPTLPTPRQSLNKSFLLLAGLSGTGKTRFVRQQAERTAVPGTSNFELIPVRPDWHEPSDLLGYVSRIDGTRYVATPFLQFMAAAWRDAAKPDAAYQLKDPADMTPFWACLDEMNLAPVEQYFADYLSVLETREWRDDHYSSEPIFAPSKLLKSADSAVLNQLRIDLGFAGEEWAGLWDYFIKHGMPLPPNLIVAGTVNMDETTHGFSRKVIDRAFTIDFGEFFPNVYADFFAPKQESITLGFPLDSHIASADELAHVKADQGGQLSIDFLREINALLKDTPFELTFRALNELLVMLKCFSPQTPEQLHAVWDDFLMAKLLPRLEGDEDKLQANGGDSLLVRLKNLLITEGLKPEQNRPDLFNIQLADGKSPNIPFRSLKKLEWMQDRLVRDRFTSFWP